jgi:hypothetical protein
MLEVGVTYIADRGYLSFCQFSPDMGPPIFGQDGPLAEMALGKFQVKKRQTKHIR